MQGLVPCLWFDSNAEEAVSFYVSVFRDAKILATARYSQEASEAAGRPAGSVMTVSFQLRGQEFLALNGGPVFSFTPAVSFMVSCKDQAEIDHFWNALSEGGEPGQCGWLTDKYGVSWQIVPDALESLVGGPDKAGAERAMGALLKMTKLELAELERAYRGE